MSRMTPAEWALVVLVLVLVVVAGWATLSYILGMRPTVGVLS